MAHGRLGDYRPDIDGLRAIAVAIVVLHHVRMCRGGFIGVDIFFVISGFLITRIVLREIDTGTFSLLNFYRRRARRIFPALFAMLLASSLAATFLLFPNEFSYFGQSLLCATFFVANIFFYQGQGYFAVADEVIPLLHTWSLSVEEQFYIIFPLLLLLMSRKGTLAVLAMMWGLLALSLLASVYLVSHDRAAAFYLFPPRAWELLLGCLLAARAIPEIPARYREPMALTALATILIAASIYDPDILFPGWTALAPCVAAAVLIHVGAGASTAVGRLLSSKPLVYLGLISYSLYLWHWPLIVFYRAYSGYQLSTLEKVLLCAASVLIASLSWRFVEQPFRTGKLKNLNAFSSSALAAAVTSAFAGLALATNGLAARYPEAVRRYAAFEYDISRAARACFIDSQTVSTTPRVPEKCLAIDPKRRNFLIVGDSHALHYAEGFQKIFPNVKFLQATASGCKPTIEGKGVGICRALMEHTLEEFAPDAKIDAIILSARWERANLSELQKTVEALRSRVPSIIVMGPIAGYDDALPRLLARAEASQDYEIVRRARDTVARSVDQAFAAAFRGSDFVRYISVVDLLCGPAYDCKTLDANGLPLQFDRAHLTQEGAAEIARMIKDLKLFPIGD